MSIDDRGWLVYSRIEFVFGFAMGVVGMVGTTVDCKAGTVWFVISVPSLVAAWLMKP